MAISGTALRFPVKTSLRLEKYIQNLQLKAYSASTIKTYKSEFTSFLQTLGNTNAARLSTQRVKDYLQYCHTVLKITENTIHSRINALKFYYEQVLHREKFFGRYPDRKSRSFYQKCSAKPNYRNCLMQPKI